MWRKHEVSTSSTEPGTRGYPMNVSAMTETLTIWINGMPGRSDLCWKCSKKTDPAPVLVSGRWLVFNKWRPEHHHYWRLKPWNKVTGVDYLIFTKYSTFLPCTASPKCLAEPRTGEWPPFANKMWQEGCMSSPGRNFRSQHICHGSVSFGHSDCQWSRKRLFHQPGLQSEDNTEQSY